MSTTKSRPIAVLHWNKMKRIADFIVFMRVFILNLVSHAAIFTTPKPTTAVVTTDVDNLVDAEALVKTRVNGAVAARNVKLNVVRLDAKGWQRYVQELADAAPDDDAAAAIIE